MLIHYRNGNIEEAILLSRQDDSIRAAVRGSADTLQLTKIRGVWVTDDCDPVHVQFAWEPAVPEEPVSIDSCICPPELAERLIRLLETDGTDSVFLADDPQPKPLSSYFPSAPASSLSSFSN